MIITVQMKTVLSFVPAILDFTYLRIKKPAHGTQISTRSSWVGKKRPGSPIAIENAQTLQKNTALKTSFSLISLKLITIVHSLQFFTFYCYIFIYDIVNKKMEYILKLRISTAVFHKSPDINVMKFRKFLNFEE